MFLNAILNKIRQMLSFTFVDVFSLQYAMLLSITVSMLMSGFYIFDNLLGDYTDVKRFRDSLIAIQEKTNKDTADEIIYIKDEKIMVSKSLRKIQAKAVADGIDFKLNELYVDNIELIYSCQFGDFKRINYDFVFENKAHIDLAGRSVIMSKKTEIEIMPIFILLGCITFGLIFTCSWKW